MVDWHQSVSLLSCGWVSRGLDKDVAGIAVQVKYPQVKDRDLMDFIRREHVRRIIFDGALTFNEQLQGPHLGGVFWF